MSKHNLHTQSGRARCLPRVNPYWQRLAKGRFLGLHVSERRTYWRARFYVESAKRYEYESLGECVDGSFEYDEAAEAAARWFNDIAFRLTGRRDVRGVYTVGDACRDLIKRRTATTQQSARGRRDALARMFERCVIGSPPEQLKRRHEPDPICDVPMTERDLTPNVINEWLTRRANRTSSTGRVSKPTTVNADFKQLRQALNAAVDAKLAPRIVEDAWKSKINRPLKVESSERRRHGYLSPAQVDAWIAQLSGTPADLLRAQYLVGCRPGKEINSLRRADFDEKRRRLTIRKGKTSFREVALSDAAVELFKRLSKDKLPGAYLFIGPEGNPIDCDTYKHIFKAAAIRAGLPSSTVPYCLRHSFITDALTHTSIRPMALAKNCGTSIEQFEKHYFQLLTHGLSDQLTQLHAAR